MAGLNVKHTARCGAAAMALAAALFLYSGCMADLGILSELADRVARENFDYGIKTVAPGANYAASLAVNGDKLYLLYFDSALQKLRIVKSPDKGKTWGNPFTVDNTTANYNTSNSLVADGSNIYVAYERSDSVYFIQLTDTGSTFTTSNAQTISTYPGYTAGYLNTVACDASNVYIVYAAGGAPAFTYCPKAASMNFPDPRCIDDLLDTPGSGCGNRKSTSIYLDSDSNLNVGYFDDVNNHLKRARFLPTDTLPMTVPTTIGSFLGGQVDVTSANYPSIGIVQGSRWMYAYQDTTGPSSMLNCFTLQSFVKPGQMPLFYTSMVVVVDDSSSDVGRYEHMLYQSEIAHIAYYDYTNKLVKYARGVKIPYDPGTDTPPYYSFEKTVIDTVGGANFDCSLASDGTTLYIAYYDSSDGGALKLAKSSDGGLSW